MQVYQEIFQQIKEYITGEGIVRAGYGNKKGQKKEKKKKTRLSK